MKLGKKPAMTTALIARGLTTFATNPMGSGAAIQAENTIADADPSDSVIDVVNSVLVPT